MNPEKMHLAQEAVDWEEKNPHLWALESSGVNLLCPQMQLEVMCKEPYRDGVQ